MKNIQCCGKVRDDRYCPSCGADLTAEKDVFLLRPNGLSWVLKLRSDSEVFSLTSPLKDGLQTDLFLSVDNEGRIAVVTDVFNAETLEVQPGYRREFVLWPPEPVDQGIAPSNPNPSSTN